MKTLHKFDYLDAININYILDLLLDASTLHLLLGSTHNSWPSVLEMVHRSSNHLWSRENASCDKKFVQ